MNIKLTSLIRATEKYIKGDAHRDTPVIHYINKYK